MKQLNCKKAKELFESDIDGEISAKEKALLTEHLAACEDCKREYEQLKAVSACMREFAADIPCALHEGVMAEIGKEKKARARFMRRIRILTASAAAAMLCVAMLHTPILNLPMLQKSANEVADMVPSEAADASTKKDFNYSADMPDGSFGMTADEEELPEIYLPDKNDADVAIQKGYRIEGTSYIIWLRDKKTAIVCYDTGNGKTELMLSAEYTMDQKTIRLTANGEYQLFDVSGSTVSPTEGDLLEKLVMNQ